MTMSAHTVTSKPSRMNRMGWRRTHLVALAILLFCAVGTAWDAWQDMATIAWKDEEASHMLLVPLVIGWLVWMRRERIKKLRPTGHLVGLGVIAIGAFLYRFGDKYLVQSFWHGGAVLMLLGAIILVAGRDVLRYFFPAFLACAFIVPVPGRLRQAVSIPLQTQTAKVTAKTLELANFEVERSGNLLKVHGVDVSVAEACNGLRMMWTLVLVSYTFAFATPLLGYVRVLILMATPISAIACNLVRLVPTIWVYSAYETHTAERFHDISGWLMLFFAFLQLMGIVSLLRWIGVPVSPFRLAAA